MAKGQGKAHRNITRKSRTGRKALLRLKLVTRLRRQKGELRLYPVHEQVLGAGWMKGDIATSYLHAEGVNGDMLE